MALRILVIFLFCLIPFSVHSSIYQFTDEEGTTHFTNILPVGKKYKVVVFESSRKVLQYSRGIFYNPKHFDESIKTHAGDCGIDPSLVKAVMKAESNFNPKAVSPKGAQGLMQLMPGTARLMRVEDPFDPDDNIKGGARYLRFLHQTFGGNLELMLAAYNAGPIRVIEHDMKVPPYEETKTFIKRVKQYYNQMRNSTKE